VTEFAPIEPVPASVASAAGILGSDPAAEDRLDLLLRLVDGFETPYSLELLATVHYASTHEPETGVPAELAVRVASWSLRKARMFTEKHISVAARRLADMRLLPVITPR